MRDVPIDYEPIKTVIIHDITTYDYDSLIKEVAFRASINQGSPLLHWVDGIIFSNGWYHPSDRLTNEELDGKVHWAFVLVAKCEKFIDKIQINGGGYIQVFDRSNIAHYISAAKTIKENMTY